jgi:hypothetical protein
MGRKHAIMPTQHANSLQIIDANSRRDPLHNTSYHIITEHSRTPSPLRFLPRFQTPSENVLVGATLSHHGRRRGIIPALPGSASWLRNKAKAASRQSSQTAGLNPEQLLSLRDRVRFGGRGGIRPSITTVLLRGYINSKRRSRPSKTFGIKFFLTSSNQGTGNSTGSFNVCTTEARETQ